MKHSFREKETPNADPELTPDNAHIGAKSATEAMEKIAELFARKTPKRRRIDDWISCDRKSWIDGS